MYLSTPYSVAIATILSSLAMSMPTGSNDATPITEEEVRQIEKRGQGNYQDYLPGCEVDPSYAPGKSHFQDGDGVSFTSSCDNGMTTPAVNRFHCWTDFFLVNWQAEYRDWQNTGQVIDCATTSSCNELVVNLNQTCVTDEQSQDNGVQTALEGSLPKLLGEKLSVGASFTYTHNWSNSKSFQICTSQANTGTCTWSDQKCHAIWSAVRARKVFGYMRRSCNSPRSGTNMPDTAQRPDGYYTVGMQDFDISVPDNQLIGCSAMCSDLTYPDPQPGGPAPLTPVGNLN